MELNVIYLHNYQFSRTLRLVLRVHIHLYIDNLRRILWSWTHKWVLYSDKFQGKHLYNLSIRRWGPYIHLLHKNKHVNF